MASNIKEILLTEVFYSLNVIGPHKLIENDTIRRSGLVEVGVAFLEEVRHYGAGIEVSFAQVFPQCDFQTIFHCL